MQRFLVAHDYGMGAVWWWIEAPSEEAIIQQYAEVIVVPLDRVNPADYADVPSLRIGDPPPPGLDGLEEKRRGQRDQPGYGALAGRGTVYVRWPFPEEEETYFYEYDEDGYRTRQVTLYDSGEMVKSGPDDWMFNPPEDLWNPALAAREITQDVFEAMWDQARPME